MRRIDELEIKKHTQAETNTIINAAIEQKKREKFIDVKVLPLRTINNRAYAIEHVTTTQAGLERLDAYDITKFEEFDTERDADYSYMRCARVDANLKADAEGGHVAILYPDEGHICALTQNGGTRWIGTWAVALSADPKLKNELMEELEQF